MKRIGATPGKLALVGVLAVVLATVVVGQLPDSSVAATPAAAGLRTTLPDSSNPPKIANQQQTTSSQSKLHTKPSITTRNAKKKTSEPPTWPDLSLETVVAFDPFAAPPWLNDARAAAQAGPADERFLSEAARRAQKEAVLKKLQEQGTTIVVISSDDKRATIGKQTVRVGDHLEGFVITDITKQGIELSE